MSRHRDVRKLNTQDELDDTALSDGGDFEITPEQEAAMNNGLQQVHMAIGDEDISGLSDNFIKEVLWECYFDVEKTVEWAAEEQQRRRIAKERKEIWEDQPVLLNQGNEHNHSQHPVAKEDIQDYPETIPGPRLPSIFLAQQQPGFDAEAYLAVDSPRPLKKFLSTITERTERTEPSTPYRSRQHHLIPNTPRSFMSSPTTSYGNELGNRMSGNWQDSYEDADPNTSRHSPSLSAIEHLNTFQAPPSNSSTSTITPNDYGDPHTISDPHSSLDNIPTIPDLESKPSEPISFAPSSPNLQVQPKKSKLAARASSVTTLSSRSTGTAVTGSIKTFPNLRPSAQSERPPSSIVSSKELPPLPSTSEAPVVHGSATDSNSSLVRMAIQSALQLEVLDREKVDLSTSNRKLHRPLRVDLETTNDSVPTPTLANKSGLDEKGVSQLSISNPRRLLSRQVKVAQERAESVTTVSVTGTQSPAPLPSAQSTISHDSRPLSKLAILAQQKVNASRKPKLPQTTTEYLTPIANGSSVTTAITTSYHSLFSLTDPSKPNFIPKLNVVPLQAAVPGPPASDQKQSKMAMKIQRGKKPSSPEFPSEEAIVTPPLSPLFLPNSRARGSPSAFASVLIHDRILAKAKSKDKDAKYKRKEHRRSKDKGNSQDSTVDSHPNKARRLPKAVRNEDLSSPPFMFNDPSPDDIVMNSRKNSSLGQQSKSIS